MIVAAQPLTKQVRTPCHVGRSIQNVLTASERAIIQFWPHIPSSAAIAAKAVIAPLIAKCNPDPLLGAAISRG
jgi:hypothetical protein